MAIQQAYADVGQADKALLFFKLHELQTMSWGVSKIGITAGASALEGLVEELIENLRAIREINLKTFGDTIEDVIFKLPKELTEISSQTQEIL